MRGVFLVVVTWLQIKVQHMNKLYKIKMNGVFLQGTTSQLVELLLGEHRETLYKKKVVDFLPLEGGPMVRFYKTRTKYCPDCGAVHGRSLNLMPAITPDFSSFFQKEKCSSCLRGGDETPSWIREFVGDE